MMLNDEMLDEIMGYKRLCLRCSLLILSFITLLMIGAFILDKPGLLAFLGGSFLGALLAAINVFALGYAFYALVFKKAQRSVILWPMLTFLCLSIGAFITALFYPNLSLGFALGLATPLAISAGIAFLSSKPA